MQTDAYIFFTECHRLFIQGMRRALRERLESAFGDDWWERGVIRALNLENGKNLQAVADRSPDRELHYFIDAPHFGWIISNHHNEVFSDAFSDSMSTFRDLRRLSGIRNDWAHIQEISLGRALQAAELIRHILASLKCEEALEVDRLRRELAFDSNGDGSDELVEDMVESDADFGVELPATEPWSFWQQLQSCLIVEKSVDLLEDGAKVRARVKLTVHNTSPDSRDLPTVYFRNVEIHGSRIGRHGLGEIEPGSSREIEFELPIRRLLELEVRVNGEVDADRLFRVDRTTRMPEEFVAPLRKEFLEHLESIDIREFVNGVLKKIGSPDATMTLAELANIREFLKQQEKVVQEKQKHLDRLYREFHLNRETTLGRRIREIAQSLREFAGKLSDLDEAMGRTDIVSITEVTKDLKQVQLALLRVEDTVMVMAKPV